MCTKWFNMDDVKALEEYMDIKITRCVLDSDRTNCLMAIKITRHVLDSDCTNCLWKYMCDWNKDNCDYIPDRS